MFGSDSWLLLAQLICSHSVEVSVRLIVHGINLEAEPFCRAADCVTYSGLPTYM